MIIKVTRSWILEKTRWPAVADGSRAPRRFKMYIICWHVSLVYKDMLYALTHSCAHPRTHHMSHCIFPCVFTFGLEHTDDSMQIPCAQDAHHTIRWSVNKFSHYSRTPLLRPPSKSDWSGRKRGMIVHEGLDYFITCALCYTRI